MARPLSAVLPVALQKFPVGLHRHEAVADAGGHIRRLRPERGHEDRGRRVGHRVDAGVLHRVIAAVMGDQPTLPELADDLDGLLEHLEPSVDRGPAMAQDVLVQSLARADPEDESPVEQELRGCGGLGQDRRVDPDAWGR